MASITTRSGKGSPLTHAEVDANFNNLNTDKAETAAPTFTGQVKVAAGTAAAPGVAVAGDLNTGLYSPGADQVAISTGGTGRLFVDESGRVGVGTSGPNVLLHLDSAPAGTGSAGVIGFGDASNYRFAEIEGYREGGSFAGSLIFRTQTSGGISAAGSERLRITSAGNVGIGTSSPGATLHVGNGSAFSVPGGGGSTFTPQAAITAATGAAGISVGVNGSSQNGRSCLFLDDTNGVWGLSHTWGTTPRPFVLMHDVNERLRVDTAGRLLVGTNSSREGWYTSTNPHHVQVESSGYTLQSWTANNSINSETGAYLSVARCRGGAGTYTLVNSGDMLGRFAFHGADGSKFVESAFIEGRVDGTPGTNDMPGRLVFSTTADGASSPTERLRITSTGRVGIGTSSPTTALTVGGVTPALSLTYNFPLNNTIGALISSVRFGDGDPGREATATISAHVDNVWSAGNGPTALRFNTAPAGSVTALPRMTIDREGRVGIGTTSPGAIFHLSAVNPEFRFQGTNGAGGTHKFRATGLNDQSLQITSADDFYINASAHVFRSQNEATERARIDSSGRLLVGTASAVSSDGGTTFYAINQFSAGNVSNQGIFLENGVAGGGHGRVVFAKNRGGASGGTTIVLANDVLGANRFFGADGTGYKEAAVIAAVVDGTPGVDDMPGRLVFSTTADGAASPTERMRITSTGQVRLAGAGITFNGDTATANELDDYEEGTFTPTVSGGTTAGAGTYSSQVGKYVKVGGKVFAEVSLEWSAHTGTGNMFLTGLPFTSAANEAGSGISVGRVNNLAIAANSYLTGYMIASNTAVALRAIPTGGGAESSVTLDTAAAINYSITYMVV